MSFAVSALSRQPGNLGADLEGARNRVYPLDVAKLASPRDHEGARGDAGFSYTRSKRSAFMTFAQAATKSFTNFSALSSWA
jgi:hypothetical protein